MKNYYFITGWCLVLSMFCITDASAQRMLRIKGGPEDTLKQFSPTYGQARVIIISPIRLSYKIIQGTPASFSVQHGPTEGKKTFADTLFFRKSGRDTAVVINVKATKYFPDNIGPLNLQETAVYKYHITDYENPSRGHAKLILDRDLFIGVSAGPAFATDKWGAGLKAQLDLNVKLVKNFYIFPAIGYCFLKKPSSIKLSHHTSFIETGIGVKYTGVKNFHFSGKYTHFFADGSSPGIGSRISYAANGDNVLLSLGLDHYFKGSHTILSCGVGIAF